MIENLYRIAAAILLLAHSPVMAARSAFSTPETDPIDIFAPREVSQSKTLDYSWWDERTRKLVISMGPSNRSRPGKPLPTVGSHIVWGHTSSYRLEGSRMLFSLIKPDVKASFTEYRRDLEEIGSRIDITTLPRNEQLAFWINLHNVAIAEQIALNWPVREPEKIRIGGEPLHFAQFITVSGTPLSLADIRTRIVFPNWRDPRVIYAFWHGSIGGPALLREAFTAKNTPLLLEQGAFEFVNSLRGTQRRGDRLLVSRIYLEAAPFYFPDFDADLRAHLAQFAEKDVQNILAKTDRTVASIWVPDIADLAGGMREPHTTPVDINGSAVGIKLTPSMARMIEERRTKLNEMGSERRGSVIVHVNSEADSIRGTEVK